MIERHAWPARNVHALQLEIDRRCYLDEGAARARTRVRPRARSSRPLPSSSAKRLSAASSPLQRSKNSDSLAAKACDISRLSSGTRPLLDGFRGVARIPHVDEVRSSAWRSLRRCQARPARRRPKALSRHSDSTTSIVSTRYTISTAGKPTAAQVQKDYLDRASPGLVAFEKLRNITSDNVASEIAKHPETFADARRCAAVLPAVKVRLAAALANFEFSIPRRVFPPITILIGRGHTGGTAMRRPA